MRAIALLALSAIHTALTYADLSTRQLPVHLIHTFPNGTWVENLALRPNGNILAAILTSPEIYEIDLGLYNSSGSPDPTPQTSASLTARFPRSLAVAGITSFYPDLFYAVTGNISNFAAVPGSYNIWEVDLRGKKPGGRARTRHIAAVPKAQGLNGITPLDVPGGLLLAADSMLGEVWRVNVTSGKADVVLKDASMAPANGSAGINGLQVHLLVPGLEAGGEKDGEAGGGKSGKAGGEKSGEKDEEEAGGGRVLYYTNSGQGTLSAMPIRAGGEKRGPARTVAGNLTVDDFTILGGAAYLALSVANGVGEVRGGEFQRIAGMQNSTLLDGVTSVRRGTSRLDEQRGSLYVSTIGGIEQYLQGTYDMPGTVARIDLHP